jgi:hypothetical protein
MDGRTRGDNFIILGFRTSTDGRTDRLTELIYMIGCKVVNFKAVGFKALGLLKA